MWAIKTGSPNTATIGKNLEVTDPNNANAVTASINRQTGIGDFLGIITDVITAKTNNDIQITGKVGINTSVPNAPLDIMGGSASDGNVPILRFSYDGTGGGDYNAITSFYNGATGGAIGFNVERVTGDAPRVMTLLGSNGSVGIGTTTPGAVIGSGVQVAMAQNAKVEIMSNNSSTTAPTLPQTGLRVVTKIAGTGVAGSAANPQGGMNALVAMAENSSSDHTNSIMRSIWAGAYNYGTVSGLNGLISQAINYAGGTATSIVGGNIISQNQATTGTISNMYGGLMQTVNGSATGTPTTTSMYGGYLFAGNNTGGINTNMFGGYNYARNYPSATTGTMYGTYNYALNDATATTMYGAFNDGYINTGGTATSTFGGYSRALGYGTSSGSLYGQYNYTTTNSANASGMYGTYNFMELAAAGSAASPLYGDFTLARTWNSSGTVNYLYGTRSIAQNYGTGTISNLYGLAVEATNNAAGTVPNIYGAYVAVGNGGAGPATNIYGAQIDLGSTSTPTNYYGLKVEDEGTVNPGWYSIYTGNSSGTGTKSYFGGNVGIGNTDPYAKLAITTGGAINDETNYTGIETVVNVTSGQDGGVYGNSTNINISGGVNNTSAVGSATYLVSSGDGNGLSANQNTVYSYGSDSYLSGTLNYVGVYGTSGTGSVGSGSTNTFVAGATGGSVTSGVGATNSFVSSNYNTTLEAYATDSFITMSAGTISTGAAYRANLNRNAGTITNYYGLKVEDEGTSNANWYSIYTGSTKSYFGGNVQVVGTLTATDLTLTSDARKKTDVQNIDDALMDITRLRPVTYHWKQGTEEIKTDKGLRYGFLAQEVEKIFPAMVKTNDKGMKTIDYIDLFAPIVDAVQELAHKVEALFDIVGKLTARIDTLEKDNKILHERLDRLEAAQVKPAS